MRYAVIKSDTNRVENVIVVDTPDFPCEDGSYGVVLGDTELCEIGQVYSSESTPRFSGLSTVPKIYTAYQFLLRFTAAERASFRAAAITDASVADFHELATAAHEIDTTNPMTIAGMDYLVSIGLLTEQRKQEVLG